MSLPFPSLTRHSLTLSPDPPLPPQYSLPPCQPTKMSASPSTHIPQLPPASETSEHPLRQVTGEGEGVGGRGWHVERGRGVRWFIKVGDHVRPKAFQSLAPAVISEISEREFMFIQTRRTSDANWMSLRVGSRLNYYKSEPHFHCFCIF